ncbi:MAG TPA: AAA family ATPase [Thermoanaerobaculia bacterium]|jgi:hypothetical protein
MSAPTIPERFRRAIVLHVAKQHLMPSASRAPLILGIHAPSGDGKTFQCENTLCAIGVKPFLISGSELESDRAGEPARLIRETYIDATRHIEMHGGGACIVINDFDAGVGNWGDRVQYTVNRQLVFGELMHIADYPELVRGEKTRRTPIILTGNDFTRLYAPLIRPGRATLFEWAPEMAEMIQVVSGIFPELNHSGVVQLMATFSRGSHRQSVAFYAALRSAVLDEELWGQLQSRAPHEILAMAKGLKFDAVAAGISLSRYIGEGKRLVKAGVIGNHLRRS